MNTEWKPIASAPKDGTPVLLFARHIDAEASTRVVGSFNADYGWIAQSYVGQPFARLIPSLWADLLPFPTSHPIPTGATGERDWELTCEGCDGDGFVYVERRVGPCQTDMQTFKEECECCEGRGFNIAFEDIPGIAEYVRNTRSAPSAPGDAQDERAGGDVAYGIYRTRPDENGGKEFFYGAMWHDGTSLSKGERMVRGRFIPDGAPAAGDALDWYERRRELEPGMIFRTAHGVVKLDSGVPGDGTKWYVLDWNGDGWSAYDDTIEPGDLIGAPVADHPIAIELARTAAIAQQSQRKEAT